MFSFNFPGGEMPTMGGGRRRNVDTEGLYKTLGVKKDASTEAIKKAYKRLALRHHPDRGGNAEKFKEITKAHEILTDERKRADYDEGGLDMVEGGGGCGGGPTDIFDLFTGGGGGRRRGRRGKRKGEDVQFPLKLELQDLYMGTTKKLRLTRNIICKTCKGKGGTGVRTCIECKGQGRVMVIRQLGPSMIQQMQKACSKCDGRGEVISAGGRCKDCGGKKVTSSTKTLNVNINKGMRHGQKVVFQGEADEAPDIIPGNVVVVLQQKKHPLFRREGRHLLMTRKLSLRESLCGFEFVVNHLDGRRLLVKSRPNVVYKHGSTMMIEDEGMQDIRGMPGNLYIEIEVIFKKAKELNELQLKTLKEVLPKAPKINIDRNSDDVDEVSLIEVDIEEEKRKFKEQKEKNQYDEDDEEDQRGHGGAQCRAQ